MTASTRRRVAITGIGMVTPIGNDAPSTWANMLSGTSGISQIENFDASGFPTRIAAEVRELRPEDRIADPKILKYAESFAVFALVAAEEAMADSGVRPTSATGERWGIVGGSGMMTTSFASLERLQEHFAQDGTLDVERLGREGGRLVSPVEFARHQAVCTLGLLQTRFGIRGYANNVHTACASGGQAVGLAARAIRRGDADFVLAGGYDSMINPLGLAGFCLLGALSDDNDDPHRASRPFDATRNGFVLGEGAAFLVLEEWESALARRADIYGELAGDGSSLSGYRITDSPPDGDGAIQAMRAALRDAGEAPEAVDYVNAHGTSTPMNDLSETNAIKAVFGARARNLPVSSTKSQIGHLIAAAGAVEGALCALAIRDSVIPATLNRDHPDPECDLDYVTEGPRSRTVDVALSNSFGFGGTNACLVIRSPARAGAIDPPVTDRPTDRPMEPTTRG